MDIADIEYIRRFIVFGGCPYMIPKRGKNNRRNRGNGWDWDMNSTKFTTSENGTIRNEKNKEGERL